MAWVCLSQTEWWPGCHPEGCFQTPRKQCVLQQQCNRRQALHEGRMGAHKLILPSTAKMPENSGPTCKARCNKDSDIANIPIHGHLLSTYHVVVCLGSIRAMYQT